MKTAIKIITIGAVTCALATPAFAYALNGTIPVNKDGVALNLQKPIPSGNVKLTVKIPGKLSAGIPYLVTFCVGRKVSSCQPAVQVPGGQDIVVFYYSTSLSPPNQVWLGQGTSAPVPYTVDVEYLP